MITDTIIELIDRHNAAPERVKPHLSAMIVERVRKIDLKGLECKLENQWRWLDLSPTHPKFISRENRFLEELGRYEEVVDTVNRARSLIR